MHKKLKLFCVLTGSAAKFIHLFFSIVPVAILPVQKAPKTFMFAR